MKKVSWLIDYFFNFFFKRYMCHKILTQLLPYSSKCALIPNYKGNKILMWGKV